MARSAKQVRTVVLDASALTLAVHPRSRVRGYLEALVIDGADLVTSSVTLAEVLRGHPRDVWVHRALRSVQVHDVDQELGSAAGIRIGRSAARGSVTIDAIIAELASRMPKPVAVMTSDLDDLRALIDPDTLLLRAA